MRILFVTEAHCMQYLASHRLEERDDIDGAWDASYNWATWQKANIDKQEHNKGPNLWFLDNFIKMMSCFPKHPKKVDECFKNKAVTPSPHQMKLLAPNINKSNKSNSNNNSNTPPKLKPPDTSIIKMEFKGTQTSNQASRNSSPKNVAQATQTSRQASRGQSPVVERESSPPLVRNSPRGNSPQSPSRQGSPPQEVVHKMEYPWKGSNTPIRVAH
eukprot:Platyproteum_vivax@DN7106_c1_g2_i2.p1